MKLAVIKTGGKQYKVREGQEIKIEKINKDAGKSVDFKEVLLVSNDDGSDVKIGSPILSGVKVVASILEHGRNKKVEVVKYKSKTRYKRTIGHRQHFTRVKIEKIS